MKSSLIAILLLHLFVVAANAQTQDQLIAGAKSEGRLVLYASAATQQLQMYMAAFNKRYPFVKTEYFRTDKQKLVTRVLLEEQTKQRIADLIHTSVIETHILKKRGALKIYAGVSHAVLVDIAIQRLQKSKIAELVTTNSTPVRTVEGFKVTVLCVSELLGEGIKRIHNDESVSSLFNIENETNGKTS